MTIQIQPSLAAGNLLNFAQELKNLENGGADAVHFDVMDGHFVPLLTLGVPFLAAVKKATRLHLDVHIMISNADEKFSDYLDAGADTLTFHAEAVRHPHRICNAIREAKKRAGIALNPGTPVSFIEPLLPFLDQVTIMTVNPGYSRQKHIPEVTDKVTQIRELTKASNPGIDIQIDGGVNAENIRGLRQLGANVFVAGGAVFNSDGVEASIAKLRQASE